MVQSESLQSNNFYKDIDWNIELSRFWVPIKDLAKKNTTASPPLYSHIVFK